jgi:hypothetical protein
LKRLCFISWVLNHKKCSILVPGNHLKFAISGARKVYKKVERYFMAIKLTNHTFYIRSGKSVRCSSDPEKGFSNDDLHCKIQFTNIKIEICGRLLKMFLNLVIFVNVPQDPGS